MINEHLNKTISAIRSDAEFIKDFPQKLATPGVDADISRLCQQSPAEAMKYREEVKKNGGVESLVFLYLNRNSDLSGVAHISVDKGIAFSFDSKITSIKQAEKYASHKIWHYVGNLAKPYREK